MRLPPLALREEAPLEELAAGDGQPVEPPALEHDGGDARGLADHGDDLHPVPERSRDRQQHAPADDRREQPPPERLPPQRLQRVPGERGAVVDLVLEREQQREVRVEVHGPPRLVLQPPPGALVRGDARHEQQQHGDGRAEHARVGEHELPELREDACLSQARVAQHDQHDVPEQEPEAPRPERPVPTDEAVLPDRPLERPDPGGERDRDHHRVGRQQPGHPACGGEQAGEGADARERLRADPQRDGDAEAEPRCSGEHVDDDRTAARRGADGPSGTRRGPGGAASRSCRHRKEVAGRARAHGHTLVDEGEARGGDHPAVEQHGPALVPGQRRDPGRPLLAEHERRGRVRVREPEIRSADGGRTRPRSRRVRCGGRRCARRARRGRRWRRRGRRPRAPCRGRRGRRGAAPRSARAIGCGPTSTP